MDAFQGRLLAICKAERISSLTSAWRRQRSDLSRLCQLLHIKNTYKNRLKVYFGFQRLARNDLLMYEEDNAGDSVEERSDRRAFEEGHEQEKSLHDDDISLSNSTDFQHTYSDTAETEIQNEESTEFPPQDKKCFSSKLDDTSDATASTASSHRTKRRKKEMKYPRDDDNHCSLTDTGEECLDDNELNVPSTFRFYLDQNEWQKIKPSKKRIINRRRLRGNWTDLFNKKFSEANNKCILKFTRNNVRKVLSRKNKCNYFVGKAVCKIQGCCNYTFRIKRDPGRNPQKVVVKVTKEGTAVHRGRLKRRQLKGKRRRKMKKSVVKDGVSNTYYRNVANLSKGEVLAGNFSNAPSMDVLRQLKYQRTQNVTDNYPISDILNTANIIKDLDTTSKKIKGYVQHISVQPFSAVLFTEKSIQLFRKACLQRLPLYFDATGSLVRKIPDQDKAIYYYTLLLKDSDNESPLTPVAELLTNSNTTVTISHFLGKVKEACMKLTNKFVRPIRIEVDFSWAIINSVLLVFNQENISRYLVKCWNHMDKHTVTGAKFTVIHLCAFHVVGILRQKMRNVNADSKLKEFCKFCFALLQNSSTLEQAGRLYAAICRVLLSKRKSSSVTAAIKFLRQRIEEMTDEPIITSDTSGEQLSGECETSDLIEGTIRDNSPFEAFFEEVKRLSLSKVKHEGDTNEYFSDEIFDIIQKLMHIFPLWSGAMLVEERKTRDTNASIEKWFHLVKNSVVLGKKNIPIGQFVRKMYVQIAGRITECNIPPERKSRKRRNIEEIEEQWCRTPVKKKSRYFTAPKTIPTPRITKTGMHKTKPKERSKYKDSESESDLPRLHIKVASLTKSFECRQGKTTDDRNASLRAKVKKRSHHAHENEKEGGPEYPKTGKHTKLPYERNKMNNLSSRTNKTDFDGGLGRDVHGIRNRRNNCWLNATLQSFTPFIEIFQKGKILFTLLN